MPTPPPAPAISITRTNTIVYCRHWPESVAFYRDRLGLPVTFANDWFTEVHLGGDAHLSLADADRATIKPSGGDGITLSWEVPDVAATRRDLAERGVAVSKVAHRWGSPYVTLHDPEGTRIELWSSAD